MKFDDILLEIGEFGLYQKRQYAMICLVAIMSAFHAMNMVFLGAKPDFRCTIADVPSALENETEAQLVTTLIPAGAQCHIYNATEAVDWLNCGGRNDSSIYSSENASVCVNRTKLPCPAGWTYSTDVYRSSIVSSFDLVCANDWLRSTSKSLYFVGRLLGAIIFGHLSDRFGRRPCFFVALAMQTLAGIGLTVSPNIIVFLILYICQGVAQVGVFLVAFTIGNELVAPRYRFITGMVIHMFYSVGYMLLAAIAYGVGEWRMLELAITLPGLLFMSYWWFLPESIRWLLSKGRTEEALVILNKAAETNKRHLSEGTVEQLLNSNIEKTKETPSTGTAIDLLRRTSPALLSLNVWLAWAVNAMVYYGLSLNTDDLGGNPYINFCISGFVEIPACVLCLFMLERIGRRLPLVGFMLVGGVTCITSGFMPEGMQTTAVVFAMIGKFAISASYVIIYLIGAEIFPTILRNAGLGVSSMCARIGGIICPHILELKSMYAPLPLLVFGVAALVSGLLCLFLPETAGKPMPQTLDDMARSHRIRCGTRKSRDGFIQAAQTDTEI